MNMRNATCVRTQTSKDPTRVAILFISYSMVALSFSIPTILLKEINTTKRFSAAMLKKSQLVNNASDLLVRQPIKMLENHYLLLKLY